MEHKDIVFADWHNAKFQSGLAASRPVTPTGLGDVYWATDTQVLSLTNTAGTAWVTFSGAGAIALNDLTDVTITTPTDGQALIYNTGTWVNGTTAIALNDLTDVSTAGVIDESFLYYDLATTSWKVKAGTFDELANVLIVSPALGNIVVFSGGQWKNLPVGTNGQVLSFNSGATYGVEWVTNPSGVTTLAALTDVSLTTPAKGDLFVYDGVADWKNLPVGTNGKALVADSAQTLGIKWDTISGGGGSAALDNAWTVIPATAATLVNVNSTYTTLFTATSGNTSRINSVIFYSDHTTDGQTITLAYYDGVNTVVLAERYVAKSGTWAFRPEHPIILPDTYTLTAKSTNSSSTVAVTSGGYMTTPVTGLIPIHFGEGNTTGGIVTVYTVAAGKLAYLGQVVAYCYGTTSIGAGSDFVVNINDGVNSYKMIDACIRQGQYFTFDLGVTLDEAWSIEINGDVGKVTYWIDGAVTA